MTRRNTLLTTDPSVLSMRADYTPICTSRQSAGANQPLSRGRGTMIHRVTETASQPGDRPLRDRVAKVINLIRPAVQSDGGDVELVEVTDAGIVRIRLHGACVGCPSSTITLQAGIERNLRLHIPEVTTVEAVA